MTQLTALPLLNTPARIARPEEGCSSHNPDDPAITVMTDLQHHRAIVISPDETLEFAEKLMIGAGVRLLLVLDARNRLAGLITSRDLHSEKALAATAREEVSHNALTVAQVMTPAARIETISLAAVRHAQVRDIVQLLRRHGRQHALVTEPDEKQDTLTVCGIFSITQIGHQLGVVIDAGECVQSFAEIEHLIAPE